jgi:hypothetical protein
MNLVQGKVEVLYKGDTVNKERILIKLLGIMLFGIIVLNCTPKEEVKNSEPTEGKIELLPEKDFFVDYLCADNENVLISFIIENSSKIASVCIAKDESYIVYRFGTQDNIEFEFPENKTVSWNEFTASHGLQRITDMYFLEFINYEYKYVVYHHLWLDEYDHETVVGSNYGIGITNISTGEYMDLPGVSGSIIGGFNESIGHKKYENLKITDIGETKADDDLMPDD